MKPTSETQVALVTAQTRVGEILTRWPETAEIIVQAGLAPLANPAVGL